ncbi:MAG: hypothetical protein WC869_00325 [Phycisphaerae bacterium]|jgi:hypothetical protein
MKIPSAHQAIKQAGLTELGTAAAIGALLGSAAERVPALAGLRETNPMLYDAAIAAGTIQVMEALGEREVGHDQSLIPLRAV